MGEVWDRQTLDTDIRVLVCAAERRSGVGERWEEVVCDGTLEHDVVVQVDDMKNVASAEPSEQLDSAGRCLKLVVSDGRFEMNALEWVRCPQLGAHIQRGCKLLLHRDCVVRGSLILLRPEHVRVLGGVVKTLDQHARAAADAALDPHGKGSTEIQPIGISMGLASDELDEDWFTHDWVNETQSAPAPQLEARHVSPNQSSGQGHARMEGVENAHLPTRRLPEQDGDDLLDSAELELIEHVEAAARAGGGAAVSKDEVVVVEDHYANEARRETWNTTSHAESKVKRPDEDVETWEPEEPELPMCCQTIREGLERLRTHPGAVLVRAYVYSCVHPRTSSKGHDHVVLNVRLDDGSGELHKVTLCDALRDEIVRDTAFASADALVTSAAAADDASELETIRARLRAMHGLMTLAIDVQKSRPSHPRLLLWKVSMDGATWQQMARSLLAATAAATTKLEPHVNNAQPLNHIKTR
ncbi:hypothetical protein FVE85_9198 [Porphyridium purpureum]|uniref:RecQ-mediated genome instability protein 1 n=1 Tax=Porphyridium purpureum TaxID=35688 RepID=A0A5J4YNN4_PORPP|nr:hypothetical protein FVE85_9198 [Porphyridium purpureum]|eukprot:POR3707..scf222_8